MHMRCTLSALIMYTYDDHLSAVKGGGGVSLGACGDIK